MIDNAVQKYTVFNPKKENCPVCDGLNIVYRASSFQKEVKIPEEVGRGYYRRINVKPSMEIIISDVTFYENITMEGGQDKPLNCLAFCLGDRLRWRVEENKKEYEIDCGESYIFNGNQGSSICSYYPEQRFLGLSIWLDCEMIKSLLYEMGKEHSLTGLSFGSSIFYKRKFSPAVKLILNEIIHCHYQDTVKKLYLEGKILELMAVYMDESIFENGGPYSPVRLSSTDMESLHKARRILDENITSPPTIGKLARLVCLNEYKLKTGFKELFGMPVHAYVIDRRLERARFLLESEKLKVAEAAQLVGYSESGRFAEKFRQKYGVNPSEYAKSL